MPLAQPISSLRQELNKLLANDDLPAGLKLCKELLPEGGEKFKIVLAMQAQLQQLNKDRMKGLISQEDYARRLAIIVDSFINFIPELETTDFDLPSTAADASSGNSPQTGSVLYRVPHSMALQKASICTIRIAIDEDAILEDIIIDADVHLKEKVEVSERMSAELLDTEGQVFDILPLNAKDQKVRPTGYTQWLFRVTPLVEGEHQLLVKVSLLEFDQNTKEYVPRDVSVLETVTVVTASQHSDEEEAPLKSAGPSFVMGPDALPNFNMKKESVNVESENSSGSNWLNGRTQRIAALFLAFLVFASSTTYAFTPKMTRDWWATTWRDTPEAYQAFIDAHRAEASGGIKHPQIEKAYYYKAAKSNELPDLREYQQGYGKQGQYWTPVSEKIAKLERQRVELILRDSSLVEIKKYLIDFPDGQYSEKVMKFRKKIHYERKLPAVKTEKEYEIKENLNINIKPKKKVEIITPISNNASDISRKDSTSNGNTKLDRIPKKTSELTEKEHLARDLVEKIQQERLNREVEKKRLTEIKKPVVSDIFQSQMVFVEGGIFNMGSLDSDKIADKDEKPQHNLTVGDFYISKFEVTQGQWRAVMGTMPSSFRNCELCPVENVSWLDVQLFLKELNANTGQQYRLPTEAEWEYAARGGKKSNGYTYAGSNTLDEVGWYEINSGRRPQPIGQKKANELGLFDMSGNVWEWCQDGYGYYSNDQTNPSNVNSNSSKLNRGGGWYFTSRDCRSSRRNYYVLNARSRNVGFRLAL